MNKAATPMPKNRKAQNPIEMKPEASGLCSCCNAFKTCTYTKDPQRPILQCEEFDGIVPSPLKMVPQGDILPGGREKTPNPRVSKLNTYWGLCSLCEDRKTCTYPKPEGGVWHCEEYR